MYWVQYSWKNVKSDCNKKCVTEAKKLNFIYKNCIYSYDNILILFQKLSDFYINALNYDSLKVIFRHVKNVIYSKNVTF